jgi:hypothetical protein
MPAMTQGRLALIALNGWGRAGELLTENQKAVASVRLR